MEGVPSVDVSESVERGFRDAWLGDDRFWLWDARSLGGAPGRRPLAAGAGDGRGKSHGVAVCVLAGSSPPRGMGPAAGGHGEGGRTTWEVSHDRPIRR